MKKRSVLIISALVAVSLIAFTAAKLFEGKTPNDLGPKVEYVNKQYVGCRWWENVVFLAFCGAPNPDDYEFYFALESTEELKTYFKNARYSIEKSGSVYETNGFKAQTFVFISSSDNEQFTVVVYKDPQIVKDSLKLNTNKPNIISISKGSYEKAKSAL